MKLKLNDTIKVMSGDDKGQTGKIVRILKREDSVLVEGVNTYKRHLKTQGNQQGGIVTLERPIKTSKVMIVCPHCSKTTRVALTGLGKDKMRICRHCQKPLSSDTTKATNKKK